jgi:hypothetical protein
VRRFVEQELASADLALARAAVRCLGAGGEPSAAFALERGLARAELAEEALEALGGLALAPESAETAMAVLARALGESALAPAALREICRAGGPRAAACIERAARATRSGGTPSREALLDALTTTGPAAAAFLLRLAEEEGDEERAAILARLPLVAGAGAELARLLATQELAPGLAYGALEVLRPSEALPWLEERALALRERGRALDLLASYEGPEPLASTLRLAQGGRVPRADVLALLVRLLEADGERAEVQTRAWARSAGAEALRTWLTLLLESGHAAAAPALVSLAFAPQLPEEDRVWAALAVGELGAGREARLLACELEGRPEGRLGAAALVSIHAHLGAEGVEELLESMAPAARRRVFEALESGGRSDGAVVIHRVARALEAARARLDGQTVAVKEIP